MAVSQPAVAVLCVLLAAVAISHADPSTSGHYPPEYSAQIKVEVFNVSGQSVYASTFNASVSSDQNLAAMSTPVSTYPGAIFVTSFQFANNRTVTFINASNSFSFCEWVGGLEPLLGSVFFPNVGTPGYEETLVVNNVLSDKWLGTGCLDLQTSAWVPVCGQFELYLSVADGTPVLYEQYIPSGQRIVQITYSQQVPSVALDAFKTPPMSQCGSQSNCKACTTPKVVPVGEYKLCNISILPSWIGAVLVGIAGAYFLWRLGKTVVGSLCYTISYFTYAVMMTSGFITHCVYLVECGKGPFTKDYAFFLFMDTYLTSCIAMSFLFNGLVDSKIIRERSTFTLVSMAATYAGIWALIHFHIIGMEKVYFGTIVIGCGGYVLLQALCMIERHSMKGIGYVLCAAISGGIGVLSVTKLRCWLCTHIAPGAYEGSWYFLSDVSMFFLLLYVLATRQHTAETSKAAEQKKQEAEFQKMEMVTYRL